MSSNVEKEAGSTEPVKDTNQPETPPVKAAPKKREYKDFGEEEEKATRESRFPLGAWIRVKT